MLKRTVISILLFAAAFMVRAQAQTLIGLEKTEVMEVVKESYRDYAPDNSIVKQQFNYLKFVNNSQTITWIIYFSQDDICTSTKKVCDYVEYDFVLDELNEHCKATGDMEWTCMDDDRPYVMTLTEQDWYFTVREKMKENKK